MNLIAEFEHFEAMRPRANPARETETTAFIQDLSERGILQDFSDVDWLKLAEKLNLTDDQYAAMFEGTASWIVPEPESVPAQEPADWPDEIPKQAREGSSSAPATRGNPPEDGGAVRGTPRFDKLLAALVDEWEFSKAELRAVESIRIIDGNFEIKTAESRSWQIVVED